MGKKQSKSKNISDDETVKRKSQSSRPVFSPPEAVAATHVILPSGWHVLPHPPHPEAVAATHVILRPLVKPIGMLDPCVSLSDAASLLGARTGPSTSSVSTPSRNPTVINLRANVDYCGMSAPGFVYNQEREKDSLLPVPE